MPSVWTSFEFSWVTWTVIAILFFQMSVILTVFVNTAAFRLRRMWQRRNNRSRELSYLNSIMAYANRVDAADRQGLITELRAKLRNSMEKGFFRRILFQTRSHLSREEFQQLYRSLGYFEDDIREIRYRAWWKKLKVALRWEIVGLPEAAPYLEPLLAARQDPLALAAMRALAPHVDQEKQREILESLSRRAPDRKDVFYDILFIIGEKNPSLIIDFCFDCYDPEIASVCLEVIRDLDRPEALNLAQAFLKSSDPEVLKEALLTFGKNAPSKFSEKLIPFLHHSSSRVRETALQALEKDKQFDFASHLKTLVEDESRHVRRLAFQIAQKRGLHERLQLTDGEQ